MTRAELLRWAEHKAKATGLLDFGQEEAAAVLALARGEDALAEALRGLEGNAADALTLVGLRAEGETEIGPWTRRYDEMADAMRRSRAALRAYDAARGQEET